MPKPKRLWTIAGRGAIHLQVQVPAMSAEKALDKVEDMTFEQLLKHGDIFVDDLELDEAQKVVRQ